MDNSSLFFKFVFMFGCAGSCCLAGFSLVVASGGYAVVVADKLLIGVTSLVAEHRL